MGNSQSCPSRPAFLRFHDGNELVPSVTKGDIVAGNDDSADSSGSKGMSFKTAAAAAGVGASSLVLILHPTLGPLLMSLSGLFHLQTVTTRKSGLVAQLLAAGGVTFTGFAVALGPAIATPLRLLAGVSCGVGLASGVASVRPLVAKNGVRAIFHDSRATAGLLVGWSAAVCVALVIFGVNPGGYLHAGPSPALKLLGISIDSWPKWACLAGYCVVDTVVFMEANMVIDPWYFNTVADPKCRSVEYGPFTAQAIVLIRTAHIEWHGVATLVIAFLQADFLIIKACTKMVCTYLTTQYYLDRKTHGEEKMAIDCDADDGEIEQREREMQRAKENTEKEKEEHTPIIVEA